MENNFIGNHFDASFEVTPLSFNLWYNNYWDDWRSILPKPIYGYKIIDFGFFGIEYLWINFDWHPSREPYDIGGVI